MKPEQKPKNRILQTLPGDVLKIDVSTARYPDAVMTITAADWKKLQAYSNGAKWSAQKATGKGTYNHPLFAGAYCRDSNGVKRKQYAHRLLLPDAPAVVFLNGDRLDLRPGNMQAGTVADSRKPRARADSQTGERCITPVGDKYRLDISFAGKSYYMGTFNELEAVAVYRDELEKTLATMEEAEGVAFIREIKGTV